MGLKNRLNRIEKQFIHNQEKIRLIVTPSDMTREEYKKLTKMGSFDELIIGYDLVYIISIDCKPCPPDKNPLEGYTPVKIKGTKKKVYITELNYD